MVVFVLLLVLRVLFMLYVVVSVYVSCVRMCMQVLLFRLSLSVCVGFVVIPL